MGDIVNSNVIIVVGVLLFILFLEIYLYTKHMATNGSEKPDQEWKKKNDQLLADLQAGFSKVTSRSTYFREQIRMLEAAVHKNQGVLGSDPGKIERFNQNSLSINQLTYQYSLLSHQLQDLISQEKGISSQEILHSQRLKEIETIRQLFTISEKMEPLLQENAGMISSDTTPR